MNPFFDPSNASNSSIFFSTSHIVVLGVMCILISLLYIFRKQKWMKSKIRWAILLLLIITELGLNIWYFSTDYWNVMYTLPFQLCSISIYLCVWMLLFKQKLIFEMVYFLGLGGATQALLTPELFFDFPHFRFLHFFIAHICIILAVLYMVWVEKYKITFSSLWKAFLCLQIVAAFVFLINKWTLGNYMFLARKPENPSLIDLLGPYPWYILSLQAVVLVVFFLLYLPFSPIWKKSINVKKQQESN
ncbi:MULTISPECIES: YwaF family protein [Bacillus]|uniref:YwaF family protein n=1 Tax=Bacillus TaxID=1386 RepID=UPI000BB94E92|nr:MULTISPECIES: TIGR02206 family membrane protein [Bacillus]